VIHYANLLFAKLNEGFPGCYDQCVSLHRLFIDAWFDGALDAAKLAEIVSSVTGNKSPYWTFFSRYVKARAADKEEYFRTLKARGFQPQNAGMQAASMLEDMLLDANLAQETKENLVSHLLAFLTRSNPERQDMLDALEAHYGKTR
jgi:hypothetical protein